MQVGHSKRKFSPEEKQQLLANLDIEVEHRTRQLESWLTDALENFRTHHEGHPSRIPRIVLGVKMRDLEEKYQGDVQVCLRAMQMDKLVGNGGAAGIERSTRKRKWLAAQDTDGEKEGQGLSGAHSEEAESSRGVKNARVAVATPKKKPMNMATVASASRTRAVQKSPGNSRTIHRPPSRAPSPSPMKTFRPGGLSRPVSRPTSPAKASGRTSHNPRHPPSTATFNPVLPKTPAYPNPNTRLPRKNESMLSMNGSPLANPYEIEIGWLPDVMEEGEDRIEVSEQLTEDEGRPVKGKAAMKKANSILVRRDPSSMASTQSTSTRPSRNGLHSRTNSNTSLFSSGIRSHSRTQSQTSNTSQQSVNIQTPVQQRFPTAGQVHVTVPTKDGFYLQFNPLTVSPGALDELEGITDSAKKQAREDMAHLVQEAVQKWSVA